MSRIARRDFLKEAPSGILALAMIPNGQAGLPEPHLSFPSEPRDRLAVASYPFRAFIESPFNRDRDRRQPGMDLPAFARMVVERFNLRGIEPLSDHFASRDRASLEALRNEFERIGVHVVDIPVGLRDSFYDPDPRRRRLAVEAGKQWVNAAVAVGSPSIRTHIAGVQGVAPDLGRAAAALADLANYGAIRNVIINLENDDLVSEDAFFIVRVLDRVHHPYLRALPDFGNSVLTGDAEFNRDALTLMFRHAYNISHMKDSETDDAGRLYTVDVPETFRIAREAKYHGYLSMEWDRPGDPGAGTARLIEESLRWLTTGASGAPAAREEPAAGAGPFSVLS